MNLFIGTICVLLVATTTTANDINLFQECLEKDSISCMQLAVFRQAKSFFDKPKIDLIAGLSLSKNAEGRSAKSIEDNSIAIETAKSVETRNSEMETYLWTNIRNFFQERSLNLNLANTARSVANAIPDTVKSDIRDLVFEGRTKKKLLLKKLLPILLGIKVKIFVLIFGALIGLLFVAKKALVISIVALGLAAFSGISGLTQRGGSSGGGGGGIFSGLGSLFGGGSSSGGGGSGGWSSGGAGGWNGGGGGGGWGAGGGGGGGGGWGGGWDSHGSYSSPVAQSIAYSAHKPTTR